MLFSAAENRSKRGMRGRWGLSDAQWRLIEPILRPKRRADGRGRPWQDTRAVLNGILLGLGDRRAVARTAEEVPVLPDLPSPFPTVGAGRQAGAHLTRAGQGARKTRPGGGLYRRLLHGDKKGGLAVGPTKRGKGTKIIALADAHSLPLAVSIESASPHESQLVEGVLGHSFLDALPARLIGDSAYDSDRLDCHLADRYGIVMIAPHRGVRRTPSIPRECISESRSRQNCDAATSPA